LGRGETSKAGRNSRSSNVKYDTAKIKRRGKKRVKGGKRNGKKTEIRAFSA
jgi:hypothetical protein